jgi:hypothetical protein
MWRLKGKSLAGPAELLSDQLFLIDPKRLLYSNTLDRRAPFDKAEWSRPAQRRTLPTARLL